MGNLVSGIVIGLHGDIWEPHSWQVYNVLQHIDLWNHSVVHLKLMLHCVSNTSIKKKEKGRNEFQIFQSYDMKY